MAIEEVQRIKGIFSSLNLHPTYREHAAVVTSEEAAKTRGDQLQQGIKALLFTNDADDWVIVNLPADKKVDKKIVADQLQWPKKKIRLATPEEVLEKTGCEIGAVPPFGHKQDLKLIVDLQIYANRESAFNIGLRTYSVKIPTSEMKVVFNQFKALEGTFSLEKTTL